MAAMASATGYSPPETVPSASTVGITFSSSPQASTTTTSGGDARAPRGLRRSSPAVPVVVRRGTGGATSPYPVGRDVQSAGSASGVTSAQITPRRALADRPPRTPQADAAQQPGDRPPIPLPDSRTGYSPSETPVGYDMQMYDPADPRITTHYSTHTEYREAHPGGGSASTEAGPSMHQYNQQVNVLYLDQS